MFNYLIKMHFCAKSLLFSVSSVRTHLCHQKSKNFVVLFDDRNLKCSALNISRNFYTTNKLNTKIFTETENSFAYDILQTYPIINKNLFQTTDTKLITSLDEFNQFLDQNWRSKTGIEIVNAFKAVSEYCRQNTIDVSDRRFDKLVDGLMDRVLELTDSELSDLLVCLQKYPVTPGFDSHNFHDIWSALDDACCLRISKWSNETKFLFADHWYRLNLGKIGDFCFYFNDHMLKKLKAITKNELLFLTFLLGVNRKHKVLFEVQNEIDKYICGMSVKEIALVTNAYTKLSVKPKFSNTVENCIKILKNELPNVDDYCILKILEVRKVGKFTSTFLKSLSTKSKFTKNELLHIFFYFNVCRILSVSFEYQELLNRHLHNLTIDEMGIIAMGFFKTQTLLKSKLFLNLIISQIKEETRTVHEITLTAILKLLRYSTHTLFVDKLLDLLDNLVPEIDRLSNLCCIHMALLGTTLQFLHKESLQKISQKLVRDVNNVDKMRVKDMERLLIPLIMFNFDPKTEPDIFDTIFKEIHSEQRRKEFVQHPRCLSSILNLLSIHKLYSYELIDQVLNMDYVIENYGKNAKFIPRDILCLDISVQVECPDYKGNRLDDAFLKRGIKWISEYAPTKDRYRRLSKADLYFLDVVETVKKVVGGSSNLLVEHILGPYVKADLIVCMDEAGNFVQPDGFDKYTFGDILRPTNEKLKWFAIIPVTWNNQIRNTNEPLGIIHMKCRQLEVLGYFPVLICWHDFQVPGVDRIKFVQNKLLTN